MGTIFLNGKIANFYDLISNPPHLKTYRELLFHSVFFIKHAMTDTGNFPIKIILFIPHELFSFVLLIIKTILIGA